MSGIFNRIFKPSLDQKIKRVEHDIELCHDFDGVCTTCVHYLPYDCTRISDDDCALKIKRNVKQSSTGCEYYENDPTMLNYYEDELADLLERKNNGIN